MIYTDDICKFHAIITDLKNSGVSVHLYGNSTECFSGAYAGFNTPPNNKYVGNSHCCSYICWHYILQQLHKIKRARSC